MHTDISIRPSYLTSAAPAEAFADHIGSLQPPRISMDNDRFNVLDDNGEPVLPESFELNVIMLWENDTRIYWGAEGYRAGNTAPPLCFSDNLKTPSNGAVEPQSELCATCPHAIRDQPGYKGKGLVSACKQEYKIACMVGGAGNKAFLLTVKPASRKPYAQYLQFLKVHHADPTQVITKLGYADKTFQFSFLGWVSPDTNGRVQALLASDEPAMIVNAFDRPRQTALPAPAPKEHVALASFPPTTNAEFVIDGPPADIKHPNPDYQPPKAPARRGRPPKETVIGPGPIPPAAFAEPSTPPTPAPAPKSNGGFGMAPAEKPPADIQDAINRAFGP